MARTAKQWRDEAVIECELAGQCARDGMNLDAEMHAAIATACASISTAISVAKPERKPNTGPK